MAVGNSFPVVIFLTFLMSCFSKQLNLSKQDLSRYRNIRRKYFGAPISYYSNTTACLNISLLLLSGDINPNPGPERRRKDRILVRNSTTPVHDGDILKIPYYGIKLVSWNVQHISNKLEEIKLILRTEEIDILCIQETFLTNLTEDSQLLVENYNIFRKDRKLGLGGGILVFVHNRLEVNHCLNLEDPDLELMWLNIQQSGHPCIDFYVVSFIALRIRYHLQTL